MEKTSISYQVILGDSLSDGGRLSNGKPLIAMAAGLDKSPCGRFTDGYTWADNLARLASLDILKEQFIEYIISAVDPKKLDDPEIEFSEFKSYIRAIDIDHFDPETFSLEKLKDSYLKRHLLEEEVLIRLGELFEHCGIDKQQGDLLLKYLKSHELEAFHPETFNLNQLLDGYEDQEFINQVKQIIPNGEFEKIAQLVNGNYQTRKDHHNNIFDAIDIDKFNTKHLNENLANFLYGSFSLGDDRRVLFQGHNFVRRFAEGGLSANKYSPIPGGQTISLIIQQIKYNLAETTNGFYYAISAAYQFISMLVKIIFSRLVLSNLEEQRNRLLADDLDIDNADEQKAKTLVTDWTGANDFITMNAFSSESVCDQAIAAKIENIILLAKSGYRNFLLMDLPDLGKTPRYLNKSEAERQRVSELVEYFNNQLRGEIEKLSESDPDLSINLFPISIKFDEIYANPQDFGLPTDIDKETPVTDVKDSDDKQSYMFWDEVHPSNLMHSALAQQIYEYTKEHYQLRTPDEITQPCCPVSISKGMLATFKEKYLEVYQDHQGQILRLSRFFGGGPSKQDFSDNFYNPTSFKESVNSMSQLYILSKTDHLIKKSMEQLGWLQSNGELPTYHVPPVLKQAYSLAQKPASQNEHVVVEELGVSIQAI